VPVCVTCPPCRERLGYTGRQGGVDTTHQPEYNHAAYHAGGCVAALIEEASDADGSSPPLRHHSCPDGSPDAQLVSSEATTPHALLSLPKGELGDVSDRVAEGMLDRRHRAGFRSRPPSAVLRNSGTHNILPHEIRIGAITLPYFPISRPYGRLS